MIHNKLVRDRIPEIINAKCETSVTHIADDEEFWKALKSKLKEEVEEFLAAENDEGLKEELADIQEVVNSILEFKRIDHETIELIRKAKLEKRGGFDKKIILEKTEEKGSRL